MNELIVFEDNQIEIVEFNGKILFNANHVANCLGIKNIRDNISTMSENQVIKLTNSAVGNTDIRKLNNTGENFLTESGVYKLIMRSNKPSAEKFQDWVTDEVLPSIKNTGSFIVANKQAETIAVSKVIANADIELLEMIQSMASTQIQLKQEVKALQDEVIYKEDVIIGLVDNIDLANKRQRLNQIMRHNFSNKDTQSDKWSLLYKEFERKYECNLKLRIERDNKTDKPKYKSKIDYIDRKMNMIPQIYELACKIFENDVEKLKSEWFSTVRK